VQWGKFPGWWKGRGMGLAAGGFWMGGGVRGGREGMVGGGTGDRRGQVGGAGLGAGAAAPSCGAHLAPWEGAGVRGVLRGAFGRGPGEVTLGGREEGGGVGHSLGW